MDYGSTTYVVLFFFLRMYTCSSGMDFEERIDGSIDTLLCLLTSLQQRGLRYLLVLLPYLQ
jgi:hypothetical protein